MSSTYQKISTVLVLASTVLLPGTVGAQAKLENPLKAESLTDFLNQVVQDLVFLSVPVIVFFIIYAGFLFVTAGGNTGKIETAQKTALYTVIGAAIILGASLIASILEGTSTNLQD
ncbi:MAG: TrbC/VirB2 family protein [Candidatus Paceibacterota bacterium]